VRPPKMNTPFLCCVPAIMVRTVTTDLLQNPPCGRRWWIAEPAVRKAMVEWLRGEEAKHKERWQDVYMNNPLERGTQHAAMMTCKYLADRLERGER